MSLCVNSVGREEEGKNGFQIWPREGDLDLVEQLLVE